jgi:Tetratricopeptide repeat
MKKILTLAMLTVLLCQQLFAQPTKADIDRMKAARLEIEKMKKDPKNKELMKNMPKGNNPVASKNKKPDSTVFLLPLKNDKLLNALPIRTFTKAELVSYLHNLNSKLTELLRSSYGTDIKNIPDNAVTKTGTSIGLWINGELEKSPLVALKGAEINPDNVILLNNVGGILTGSGLGVNAIPILQYVLDKQPGNNMILNNLGQAYLQLGDDKKAEQYLLQCVSSYNYYPDANLALAYIYNSRGNKSSAIKYAENSLRGAWSEGADNLLHKLKPDARLMDYIRHRYKQPETFNFNKYPLLPQCRDTKNTPLLKPQYAAYKEMLAGVKNKYFKLSRQEGEIAKKTVTEKVMNANKLNKSPFRPFGLFANVVAIDLWVNEYSDKFLKFSEYKKNYLAQKEKLIVDCLAEQKEITAKYKTQKDDVAERDGEGSNGSEYDALIAAICAEKEVVRNRYLNLIADVIEAYQQEAIHLYKDYFNDMAFWYYVGSIDDHQYKSEFYGLVSEFLLVLADINTTHTYTPCHNYENKADKAKEAEIEEPDCYIPGKFEVPLGALKLELSCETYKLEVGEGFVGKLEYNRSSGDFTLAFGVGASVPRVFYKTPGLELGMVGEAKSQLYITFDKRGTPTDLGILWESELKLEANMSEVKYSVGMEEGLTAGFGTGVLMREGGQLKAFIDKTFYVQPDAKQINKNVPLYKK